MSATHQPPLILFLAFPGVGLLDLSGPQTVFWAVQRQLLACALHPYERHTVSFYGGPVRSEEGVVIDTLPFSAFEGRAIDTIVVPGASRLPSLLDGLGTTVDWIRQASACARRTASVCSGAFLLAQAGLLDGRRAATHWSMLDLLARRFPSLDVDRDAIFVHQDQVWTSAGVTAGIDLALALIEEDHGREVAMGVARDLVVYMKRPGRQSQDSKLLRTQAGDSAGFDALHRWLLDNLHQPTIGVDVLARLAHMSVRNFSRVYKEKTGRSPARAVELFRVEAARRMLEQAAADPETIARQCGFRDQERMRAAFQRHTGMTPAAYRKRFGAGDPG